MANRQNRSKNKQFKNSSYRKARIKAGYITIIAAIVVTAVIVITSFHRTEAETYSDGHQTINLCSNGKFVAHLAHDVKHEGMFYLFNVEGGRLVVFTQQDISVLSTIEDEMLYIPLNGGMTTDMGFI